jgi:hypothetical protein
MRKSRTVLNNLLPVAQGRTPGEPFVPKSSKEAEMEKMMRSMEVIIYHCLMPRAFVICWIWPISCFFVLQGMPGAPGMKMYSRDDLMNMNNLGGDDDEEDDDDEADFPSNLVL